MKRAALGVLAVVTFATAVTVGLHDVCWVGDGYGSCTPAATGTTNPGVPTTGTAALGQVVDDAATPDASPSATKRPPSPSRAVRSTDNLTAKQRRTVPFEVWLASPTSVKVQWRESNNRCDITNPSGKYQGKWQFDTATWLSNGGGKYARRANLATCHEQDLIAYATWLRRGWAPWTTAY